MASDNADIHETIDIHEAITRLEVEASSTDDAIRHPAMLRLALLRQVLNNTSSVTSIGRCQPAFAGVANGPNPDLTMQNQSSSDPLPSSLTLTHGKSYDPQSYRTLGVSVEIEKKRSCGAAAGDSTLAIHDPPQTPAKAKRNLRGLTVEDLDLYVDGKWTDLNWLEHVWNRNVRQADILCRLGLVAPGALVKNHLGVFSFDNPTLTELSRAVHELSETFHDERFDRSPVSRGRSREKVGRKLHDKGRDRFIQAACNPYHLNHELNDLLFDRFGPSVWGMDIAARKGCTYRLELENDDDRPKIEALIHLWVFVKIANRCRGRRRKAMKKDAKAAEDEMSNVAESETSEHEDSADEQVAREVADDGADFTTAKNDGDVNATRRMKRKRDLEEAAPPAPSVGDTEDEDTVETPSEKKHCSSRQAAQDAELMGAVPADDRTEPTELPRAHSDSTITVSKTTVNEPATTTPLSSTASAPVDNARATFRSRFPDLQTYMKSLHGDLPNIPPHLAVHKARKQT